VECVEVCEGDCAGGGADGNVGGVACYEVIFVGGLLLFSLVGLQPIPIANRSTEWAGFPTGWVRAGRPVNGVPVPACSTGTGSGVQMVFS
jgi:hypothetical protein